MSVESNSDRAVTTFLFFFNLEYVIFLSQFWFAQAIDRFVALCDHTSTDKESISLGGQWAGQVGTLDLRNSKHRSQKCLAFRS